MKRSATCRSAALSCAIAAVLGTRAHATPVQFDVPSQAASSGIREFARQAGVSILSPSGAVAKTRINAVRGTMEVDSALELMLRNTDLRSTVTPSGAIVLSLYREDEAPPRRVNRLPAPAAEVSATVTADDTSLGEVVVTGSRIVRSGFTTPTPVTVLGQQQLQQMNITNVGAGVTQLPGFRPSSNATTNASNVGNLIGAQVVNLRGLGSTRTLVLVDGRRFAPTVRESGVGGVDLGLIPSAMVERAEVVTGGASAAYGSDAIAGVVNIILDKRMTGIKAQVDYGISGEGDGGDFHASIAGGSDLFDGRGHFILGGEYDKSDPINNCSVRDWCHVSSSTPLGNSGVAAVPGLPAFILASNTGYVQNQAGVISILQNNTAATLPIRNMLGTGAITFDSAGQPIPYHLGAPASGNTAVGGDITNTYAFVPLSAGIERQAAYGHMDYDFSDDLHGFVEGSFGHVSNSLLSLIGYSPTAVSIFSDNPFIPEAIRVAGSLPAASATPSGIRPDNSAAVFNLARLGDLRTYSHTQGDTYRLTLGLDGKLASRWRWSAYYQYGHSDRYSVAGHNLTSGSGPVINRVGGAGLSEPDAFAYYQWATDPVYDPADAALPPAQRRIVCRATISPNPALRAAAADCAPLNTFGQGVASQAALDYVYRTATEEIDIAQHVAAVNIQGDVADLWAGPLTVAGGVEYHRDSEGVVSDPYSNAFALFQALAANYRGKQDVIEGYIEGDLPLLKDLPFAKTLSLNVAGRKIHYKISGEGANSPNGAENSFDTEAWKIGLVWDTTDWLRLRATRSRDIRAPNLSELFLAGSNASVQVTNRFAAGSPVVFPSLLLGANPNLQPEKADTTTFGVVFQPKWGWSEDRLRLSLDYYNIKVGSYIGLAAAGPGSGAYQSIVDRCYFNNDPLNCGLITFGADNSIAQIRNTNINLQNLRTRGLDVEADYRLPLQTLSSRMNGELTFRALATFAFENSTELYGVVTDYAGQTGQQSGQGLPDWLLNVYTTYSIGPFSTTLQLRYIPEGLYDVTRIGPDDARYAITLPNSVSNNTVDSRLYANLSASYLIGERGAQRLQVFGSVNNLFDKDPPLAPQLSYRTNPTYFDQIGRYFRVGLRLSY